MSYKVAFQMDDIQSLNLETDSTIMLINEALHRGYQVFCYRPEFLELRDNVLFVTLKKITFCNHKKYSFSEELTIELSTMDIIFVRQEPPFDMKYITSTYLLEYVANDCFIVNNPKSIRDFPEKIYLQKYNNITPKTIITSSLDSCRDFLNKYKKIVLKPLYAYGGKDVFCIENEDSLFKTYEYLITKYNHPIVVQKFITKIIQGDKRIILFFGKPVGAVLRKPNKDNFIANFATGGKPFKTELTLKEQKICQIISNDLIKNDIYFAGIDVIGGLLTEINVTCPTGLSQIDRLENTNLAKDFWNILENKLIT